MKSHLYSGLWMFAWDLADEGIDNVMGWSADSGLTALQIAGSYHAGWFVHPHNPKHRVYMPEDGCIYFQPAADLYKDTILKPRVASVCATTDWMQEAGKKLDQYGLKLVSWTVCAHNTRLGMLHPECTVVNCFGDHYPHALCPANENVRRYFMALCRDLAMNFPMHAIQLESPGYMGMAHGHHHERDLTVLTPLESTLINLCFCATCIEKAEAQNLDVKRIRVIIREILDRGMSAAPARPSGHPRSLDDVMQICPEIAEFLNFRQEIEDTLLCKIKVAVLPYSTELWHFGTPNPQIADAIDVYNGSVYGQKPATVLTATKSWKEQIAAQHKLYMGVRLGLNSVADQAELTDIVRTIDEGGGDGVMFYNYSESPITALNWIKPALLDSGQTS